MKQLQPPTLRTHRRPNVLVRQALTDLPRLTQKTDRPVSGYTPYEMHPPCRDRQLRRQVSGVAFAQAYAPDATLRYRTGAASSGLGFTGELQDSADGTVYLRSAALPPSRKH
jgi:hypothetical protein